MIWTGALRGAVDVYVWTSPNPGQSGQPGDPYPLADLLAQQPIGEPVAKLRGPHDAAQARLAIGASMQLAALARASLRGPDREVTAVFHGSFGADDAPTTCTTVAVSFGIALRVPGA